MASPGTQAPEQSASVPRGRWRTPVAIVLIVLACVLAIPATVLSWTNRELTNTDAYVETVKPLVNSEIIQRVVTDKITTAIFDQVDEKKFIHSGIDALADAGVSRKITDVVENFDDSMVSAIRGFIEREIAKIVASATAAELWETINRVVHSELASALAGDDTRILHVDGNDLVANTGELSKEVKQRIADKGFGLINLLPTISTDITVVSSPQISQMQSRYQELTFAGRVLPWVVVVLFIAAIAIALYRRREVLVAGIGLAVAMFVLAIGLWIASLLAPDSIPSDVLPTNAAQVVIDTVLRSIWRPIWFLLALGAVSAVVAYLCGPGRGARQVRESATKALAWTRQGITRWGWHISPADAWVRRFQLPLISVVGVLAALSLLLWDSPTWRVPVWTAVFAALAILVIAFLALEEPEPIFRDGPTPEARAAKAAKEAMKSLVGQARRLKTASGPEQSVPDQPKQSAGD